MGANVKLMDLADRLRHLRACDEAIEWVGSRSPARAWRECQRGDWLLWVAARLGTPRRLIVHAAVACARTALHYAREEDLLAVLLALHVADEFAAGRADAEDCAAAGTAAVAAGAAAEAAMAAADAAGDAGDAGDAAWAARAAAWASWAASWAAWAAAEDAALAECARIVRRTIPWRVVAHAANHHAREE